MICICVYSVRALVRVREQAKRTTEFQEAAFLLEFISRSTDGDYEQGALPSDTFSYRMLQPLPSGTDIVEWVAFCNIRAVQKSPPEPVATRPVASDTYTVESLLAWYVDADGDARFLVKWEGYTYAESTWVYVN